MTTASARGSASAQGLALAILTGVFVGDDGGLYANLLDLLGVHDQVGIGVAEAFLAHDNAVKVQQTAQLSAPVGGTLLVGQVDVFVGDYVANIIQGLAVLLEQIGNDGVILMMIGGVLIAGGNAVTAYDSARPSSQWGK